MRIRRSTCGAISITLSVLMAALPTFSDGASPTRSTAPATQPAAPPMKQEEMDQLLAPIALYPDSLLSQVLMASTYPLEIIRADRWVDSNKDLKGDPLAVELEKQPWDPSVKSLVNFPEVLNMMSEKVDWTVKLGDAFISQQKQVMDTIQTLRGKAQATGNLKTTEQQQVTIEPATATQPQVIVIESSNPQVVYVPTYNPTVVYGTWPYPAYPPYYYYPPAYRPAPGLWFGAGVAVGMAWGYAWGSCNWHGGDVNVNVNRNVNVNNDRINHNNYRDQIDRNGGRNGQGDFRHDPAHRDGVAYRDKATAQQFGRGSSDQAQRARDSFRGQSDSQRFSGNNTNRPTQGGGQNRGNVANRPSQGGGQNLGNGANRPSQGGGQRAGNNTNRTNQGAARPSQQSGTRTGAFNNAGNGNAARANSQRGQASRGQRAPAARSGGGRAGGGGGGRGGGGGGRR